MTNLLLQATPVAEATMEVAQNIHEYGIAVVICSLFVVLSAALMITCFRWFKSIIEQIMSNYSVQLSKLYEASNRNGEVLVDIAEGLVSETILKTKTITESLLDVAFLKSKDLVARIIDENNIQNKEATKIKVIVIQVIAAKERLKFLTTLLNASRTFLTKILIIFMNLITSFLYIANLYTIFNGNNSFLHTINNITIMSCHYNCGS